MTHRRGLGAAAVFASLAIGFASPAGAGPVNVPTAPEAAHGTAVAVAASRTSNVTAATLITVAPEENLSNEAALQKNKDQALNACSAKGGIDCEIVATATGAEGRGPACVAVVEMCTPTPDQPRFVGNAGATPEEAADQARRDGGPAFANAPIRDQICR